MCQLIKKYGGPENYLRQRYATRAAKQEWLNYLGSIQKVEGAENYCTMVDLPVANVNKLNEADSICCFACHRAG
jgi:hypothetical protein